MAQATLFGSFQLNVVPVKVRDDGDQVQGT